MKCLRCKAGVTRLNGICNEDVEIPQWMVDELADRDDPRVLRWFGHIGKMDEGRLGKRVLNVEVNSRILRGRPIRGWMDAVKNVLVAKGIRGGK